MAGTDSKNEADRVEMQREVAETNAQPATEDVAAASTDATPEPAETAKAAEPAPEDKPRPLSPREEIAARFKERRDEENKIAVPDADAAAEQAQAAETAEPRPVAPAPAAKRAEPGDDDIIQVKVDGTTLELPYKDAKRIIQQNLAADNRLREANARLDNVRRMEAEVQSRQSRGGDQPREAADRQPDRAAQTGVDPATLEDLAERISVGTKEEAAAALSELLAMAANKAPKAPDINAAIDSAFRSREEKESASRTVQKYKDDYPDLAADDDLSESVRNRIVREMITDMRKIGVPDDELAEVRDHPLAVKAAYDKLRNEGWEGLRDYQGIMKSAADHVRGRFVQNVQPKPSGQTDRVALSPERTDRKRAAQPQPRSAGIRADTGDPNPPRRAASDVVKAMQKARGQPVAG